MSMGWWDTTAAALPPHLMEGWGLGFSPSHTRVGFVGLLSPVLQSPVLLGPQLSYGVALGGPTGLRWPRERWQSPLQLPLFRIRAGSSAALLLAASSALPEQKVSGVWQANHVWK